MPPEPMSADPLIWLAADALGVGSEIWMRRQWERLDGPNLGWRVTGVANRVSGWAGEFSDSMVVAGHRQPPPTATLRAFHRRRLAKSNRVIPGVPLTAEATRWLIDQIERDPPAVVLGHFGPIALDLLPLFERFKIPIVPHFNGNDLSQRLNDRYYVEELRAAADRIPAWIVVAKYMRTNLLRLGVAEDRIHRIPYGVPIPEAVDRDSRDRRSCRFLAVGRFTGKKRPDLTIRAFAAAASQLPEASLRMIGDGRELARCRRLAARLDVADRIVFDGAQPPTVVGEAMADADVFVQHSVTDRRGDREGWPVAIGEAAAAGLPIVSTRHASIPEQVIDGETGVLVDEGDVDAMGSGMHRLGRDADLRETMSLAARRHARRTAVDGQVAKLSEVLRGVTTSSVGTAPADVHAAA